MRRISRTLPRRAFFEWTTECAVQADAGVLLAGLHDERELPVMPVDVADRLEQVGARRDGDARACSRLAVMYL